MRRLTVFVFVCSSGLGAFGAGVPAGSVTRAGVAEPLQGEWDVYEGREEKGAGICFETGAGRESTIERKCGTAHFMGFPAPQQLVSFTPALRFTSRDVPWGEFNYGFESGGVLTLTRADRPPMRCFLKYKEEGAHRLDEERDIVKPNICIFYNSATDRAFKLVRKGSEIAKLNLDDRQSDAKRVFVPFKDILTKSWLILPGHPTPDGKLEFSLTLPASEQVPLIRIGFDNSAQLFAGGSSVTLQLRQYDPTHWAFAVKRAAQSPSGTLTVEKSVAPLLGPNVLMTQWEIGGKTMTAVLRAEGGSQMPRVPVVRFFGATPFQIDTLLAASLPDSGGTPPAFP